MYKIYVDNYLIYDDSLDSLKVFEPKMTLALNSVSSCTFTIYPDHPYFDQLKKLKSIVKVFQDGVLVFKGRILNDKSGFYNEKKVTCESDLSFLLDSVQRPYEFQGTPADLFRQFIANHNAEVNPEHRFEIGNITVTDPNDYIHRSDSTYLSTFDSIQQKLIDGLEGYLWTRYENDVAYIDYLSDFGTLSSQTIEFGKNLLSYVKTTKAEDIFTVIIPLGSSEQDEEGNSQKVTIASVNDGKDYLENVEATAQFGRIVKKVEWSDVTLPSNLKTKAQAMLDKAVLFANTIELTAADLGGLNQNISSFHLGTKVRVLSKPHNVDSTFLVKKLTIDMVNPASNKITLGTKYMSMSDQQHNEIKNLTTEVVKRVEDVKFDAVLEATKQYSSSIEASTTEILTTVTEQFVTKEEIPTIISSQTTEMKQTVDGWEQRWTTFSSEYDADKVGVDRRFQELQKYIRYIDGKIILGEVGNELELRIANNELGFYQDNVKVAYFSDKKMFVTDGEFTNSLNLGKFAFIPRTNGNLSFKKVKN